MDKYNELLESITTEELREMLQDCISYDGYFNAYGNLESCDEYEMEQEIEDRKEEIVDHYLELYSDDNVYPSADLKRKLYDYYEEDEEEN